MHWQGREPPLPPDVLLTPKGICITPCCVAVERCASCRWRQKFRVLPSHGTHTARCVGMKSVFA
eukprot:scaffold11561_cov72-Phaeocystis_antarctica.AAC.2